MPSDPTGSDDLRSVGVSLPEWLIDELDELAVSMDRQRPEPISRSAAARRSIALGIAVAKVLDEEPWEMHLRAERNLVRQGAKIAAEDLHD